LAPEKRVLLLLRYKDTTRSLSSECLGSNQPVISLGLSDFALDIRMPGVTPKQSDTYLCMSVPLPVDDEAYVVDFKPHASMDTVHHMLLFGCKEPSSTESYWDCDEGTCKDKSNILYAWARNAPPTRLPKVWFRVGEKQMRYLCIFGNSFCNLVDADISCHYKRFPMHLFAYRVHTHRLGKVVSGYRVRNGQWTLIGRQSPQLPQAFYPVEYPVDISYDDILAARCVFSGEGRTTETHIGGTANDEMCNFYIMYYMEAKHAVSYMTCTQNANPEMFRNIPPEANIPIPVKSDVLKMMHGHHEETKDSDTSSLLQQAKKEEEEILDQGFHIEEAVEWPGLELNLGQVSGLSLDPENNLVVFHRGDRVWDENSFDSKFVYQQRGLGPIDQNTIIVMNPSNAKLLHSTGKSLFYLPHGLSVDKNGNFWVTDVALHQVFKLGASDKKPLLTLGVALQPGSDRNHFCQPTDVAVDPITGSIYVSDGYCNSRIIQFSPKGLYVMQWGEETSLGRARPGQFHIPHSLTLIPELSQLCVADRENGRIQCFRLETGEFTREIKHNAFGRELFAVAYVPGGLLFAVNGMPYPGQTEPVQGFVMNFSTGEIIDTFIPLRKSFEMPHDIVASEDRTIFVGDVHARTVWKFASAEKMEHRSVKKAGIEVQETKGKGGGGGINLGNFFASHKGYSRKGFDRLSTEGSDQEKDEDDGTDSEEECSASPLPPAPSSS
uniref:Peptidylglycine alpha-amidating monooxygenase n=1 Tax=Malurus cyaneus samueli TaxID=2593467 RepID=A0A8C5TI50_9PASS